MAQVKFHLLVPCLLTTRSKTLTLINYLDQWQKAATSKRYKVYLWLNCDPKSDSDLVLKLKQSFQADKASHLFIFHQPFYSYAATVNFLFNQARARLKANDYLVISNDDLVIKKPIPVTAILETYSNIDYLWPVIKEGNQKIKGMKLNPINLRFDPTSSSANIGSHGPLIILKNTAVKLLINRYGFFLNPKLNFFWEDTDLNLRLKSIGTKNAIILDWSVRHLSSQSIKHQSSQARYYYHLNMLKFWYIWSPAPLFWLIRLPIILLSQLFILATKDAETIPQVWVDFFKMFITLNRYPAKLRQVAFASS